MNIKIRVITNHLKKLEAIYLYFSRGKKKMFAKTFVSSGRVDRYRSVVYNDRYYTQI